MGLTTGNFPPVDVDTFLDQPLMTRMRALATHWAEYGFGAPKITHVVYVAKLLVLYVIGGLVVASATSGLGAPWHLQHFWAAPILYEKAIVWTVLLETVGLAGSWGPLAGHFKPMTGGILYWARPGTLRMPPWPDAVPLTRGDERTPLDVALYLALLADLVVALVLPSVHSSSVARFDPAHPVLVAPAVLWVAVGLLAVVGLRDKVVFIAARSEQYIPALIFFAVFANDGVNLIVALKLLIVSVWMGAGVSKFGYHFSNVVPPMVSNTPWIPSRALKRAQYRNFPEDLRPSHAGSALAHIGGTTVELVTPLVLLLSTNRALTIAAVCVMVAFHLFIISTFPLAVPLEWNVLFGYAAAFLFIGHPAQHGFSVADMSAPWITALICAGLVTFPVLGNLRPDLVSFLPSMRQYAGNWASAMWAFAPGAEAKLDRLTRAAGNQVDQLKATYPPAVAEITMQQTIAWRSLHSQGRGLFSLMLTHLGDRADRYTIREAEFACNSIVGFNFGDGHFHDHRLIAAIQRRCRFEPGEFVVAWVESQPIHKDCQEYMMIDAATGIFERGTFKVRDCVEALPWLPDGPIALNPTWRGRSPFAQAPAPAVDLTGVPAPAPASPAVATP